MCTCKMNLLGTELVLASSYLIIFEVLNTGGEIPPHNYTANNTGIIQTALLSSCLGSFICPRSASKVSLW